MKKILLWMVVFALLSCDHTDIITKEGFPSCLQAIIQRSNSPLEIWSYQYNNQIVYLAKGDCCDQYDQVYASDCSLLCAPSGGFSGKGDGKCPDFYDRATNGIPIWKKK
jgi:hypothetical protein